MIKHLLTALILCASVDLYAQNHSFEWAVQMGASEENYGRAIVSDADGNVYTTGNFSGSVDFDPGSEEHTLTAVEDKDVFVTKFDKQGDFLWAIAVGGSSYDIAYDILLDDDGNVLVGGAFGGYVEFEPGNSSTGLSAEGNSDAFLWKLNTAGEFLWVKQFGGAGNDLIYSLASGTDGYYASGLFEESADLDPGENETILSSAGQQDIFIAHLNPSGNFVWAKQFGNDSYDFVASIALDHLQNLYITGMFNNTVDFNPNNEVFDLTAETSSTTDVFLVKLSNEGAFSWAKKIGGPAIDLSTALVAGPSGEVYLTGVFQETCDFNPAEEVTSLTATGPEGDTYVAKFSEAGELIWVKKFSGYPASQSSQSIALDAYDGVYLTGWFTHTVDFDPGINSVNRTSGGGKDAFIVKLNTEGSFDWVLQLAGAEENSSYGIALDDSLNIYTAGYFQSSVDFDPGEAIFDLTCSGEGASDVFVMRISQPDILTPNKEDMPLAEQWQVYPNPAASTFTVQANHSLSNGTLRIRDLSGQLLMQQAVDGDQLQVNVSGLTTGTYLIELEEADQTSRLRWIKN